jgi:hypothetical protein
MLRYCNIHLITNIVLSIQFCDNMNLMQILFTTVLFLVMTTVNGRGGGARVVARVATPAASTSGSGSGSGSGSQSSSATSGGNPRQTNSIPNTATPAAAPRGFAPPPFGGSSSPSEGWGAGYHANMRTLAVTSRTSPTPARNVPSPSPNTISSFRFAPLTSTALTSPRLLGGQSPVFIMGGVTQPPSLSTFLAATKRPSLNTIATHMPNPSVPSMKAPPISSSTSASPPPTPISAVISHLPTPYVLPSVSAWTGTSPTPVSLTNWNR